ncbi:MAG: 50S ribosomal protein L11 methyltransferase [Pseudomonadales bacterium]|nr:50S ribosomal protein L11 methyltransferase [Pseudomonadales bacterium]
MTWLQLQIRTDPERAHRVEASMENSGALSVTMTDAADQPLLEPGPGETPLWSDILITGLYPADLAIATLIEGLKTDFLPDILPPVNWTRLADQNWQRAWMTDFKPMPFGRRLWICPSWCAPPDPTAINLLLDPGLAFGTGTHPTTALCLQWLDGQDLDGQELIDYGCGSGILGIAALLLGATRVYGVDNDPQALLASRDNCDKNQLASTRFETFLPDAFLQDYNRGRPGRVDGIAANILAAPLISLAHLLASFVRPGGWLLLSGILEAQAEAVMAAYRPWFTLEEPAILDGWVRITALRSESDTAREKSQD